MIHPTAIVHPKAKLAPTVQVGPYAVIDEGVEIGAHCLIGPHVYLTGLTCIGAHNQFHAGCVIGDAPQDVKYDGTPTRLRIGDHNLFREHVTVHRSNTIEAETVIGSHNFLMANSHVAHNCRLGDFVIIANGALLGGHVTVQDRAFISGNCMVHQFTRIGTLALMQGGKRQQRPPALHGGAPQQRDLRVEQRGSTARGFHGRATARIEAALSRAVSSGANPADRTRCGAKKVPQHDGENVARLCGQRQTRCVRRCEPR
jgi:acyl-ACP--UDP-N-acetylglucosamine O-acyltransferase